MSACLYGCMDIVIMMLTILGWAVELPCMCRAHKWPYEVLVHFKSCKSITMSLFLCAGRLPLGRPAVSFGRVLVCFANGLPITVGLDRAVRGF